MNAHNYEHKNSKVFHAIFFKKVMILIEIAGFVKSACCQQTLISGGKNNI
jgi:hypothetical protein